MGSSAAIAAAVILLIFITPTLSGPVSYTPITPDFTATYYNYVDNSGAFLASPNNTFQARITNPTPESPSYYLAVIHVASNTIIWSANRNKPITKTSKLSLTNRGLALFNDTGHPVWSTPHNLSTVRSLTLLENGNLVLTDLGNNTLWASFDFPTDVLVEGQRLNLGSFLVSSVNSGDLSEGGYRLVVGGSDVFLQWNEMNYWMLSMETRAFRERNYPVEYMVMNFTGLFLMGQNGEQVVVEVVLENRGDSGFRVARLDQNGVFSVVSIGNSGGGGSNQEFKGPDDSCRIPNVCRELGVCTNGGSCQCASPFHVDPRSNGGDCVPTDGSLVLPGSCDGSLENGTTIKYLNLRSDLDYFSNNFVDPVTDDVNLSACESLCTRNCTCLGIFYSQSTRSCYLIRDSLGSLFPKSGSQSDSDRVGFVKTLVVGNSNGDLAHEKSGFSVLAMVLLPAAGVLLISIIATIICLKRRKTKNWWKSENSKLGRGNPNSFDEEAMDYVFIPGLPVRFQYKEILAATQSFNTQIGSGGFGTVYKGILKDATEVAVKKITCLGAQGQREFLTEIAVIGKIHHVNLVKLKGFCAHAGQRFLLYEYMNRGSLDHTLFRGDPVLEWKERFEIALGTARGLAYLHSGCEHKIIHCDVKPENILLHDKSQVKLSDFGLSKLLSPEQSGLFTTMRGTRGYLAPEWLTSSTISDKTDVYSYGMVLLEIIRGKKNSAPQERSTTFGTDHSNRGTAVSPSSSGESGNRMVYFPLFALEMHEERNYLELADPRLMGRVQSKDVEKLVRVALCCVQEEPNLRPSMTNVVGMLEGGVRLGEPRLESLNFLRFYGRRFSEASVLVENNEENHEVVMYRQQGSTASSYNSLSYLSSQEVSGPR